ncbi:MAG TPA: patatin-like phospholipase family protein [Gaiellaceae bacterium]|nr:patatin-like phospholipase family protein [Gaiellaceae bacterium]
MAEIERGPWPDEPDEVCDLVMKGGVASGVVYPGAILALAKRYRFRNVGGTSAGAIAATVTAAAELGRREGRGGFERLCALADAICEPGRVLGLFQPVPRARPAFDLAVGMMDARAKGPGARWRVASLALRPVWLPVLALALAWLAAVCAAGYAFFMWLGWWSALGWPVLAATAALGIATLAAAAITVGVARPALGLVRTLEGRAAGYGLCPGTTQPGFEEGSGLADWLHEHVQACAGREPGDPPLTFADLAAPEGMDELRGVVLQLMTTDVSAGRPVRLPLPDDNPFLFDPEEIARVVPADVAEWMRANAERVEVRGRTLYRVPGSRMPVLLATRMSLAVPALLAAVPFYEERKGLPGDLAEHWFCDGAVTSNFPVHFFDALLPGHPTFGLDLMGSPDPAFAAATGEAGDDPTLRHVYLPDGPAGEVPLRWASVGGLGGLIGKVLDTALNWRDTMQMEMPGFHERVCHIRLSDAEGGLNLSMDEAAVRGLMERGADAGEAFVRFDFAQHRFTRYLTFMQMLEAELKKARERFGFDRPEGDDPRWFRVGLAASLAGKEYPWTNALDPTWCAEAREATQALLDLAARWGADPPPALGFDRPDQTPVPRPALRIVPPV